jgi:hypothetical protein
VFSRKDGAIYKLPSESGTGHYVPFYFHVYNVLSDLPLTVDIVPGRFSEDIIESGLTFAQPSMPYSHQCNIIWKELSYLGTRMEHRFTYTIVVDGVAFSI